MKTAAIVGLALTTLACSPRASLVVPDWSGPPGSGESSLATTRNGLLLTWLERTDAGRHALRIATRTGGRWSPPKTVVEGADLFVNWADFPSAVEAANGDWVVHWLTKTAEKSYAYHVKLSRSRDRGATWSPASTAHVDRSPTEHGFVALVPDASGDLVRLAWLDGGAMVDSGGAMALRGAGFGSDGAIGETAIDERTCECCQVAMARAAAGLVVAYRDRSPEEVRDIAVAREVEGRWLPPVPVGRDGWVWKACPVNGPSIAARGDTVAVAWYTAAGGKARVQAAHSVDGGASFGPPVQIDEGNALGRVQIVLSDGGPIVVWLESGVDEARWRVRTVSGSRVGRPITIGTTRSARDAGFPRAVLFGSDLFVSWTDPGSASPDSARVRVSRIPLDQLPRAE
jgi:hypothetical protein